MKKTITIIIFSIILSVISSGCGNLSEQAEQTAADISIFNMSVENVSKIQIVRYADDGTNIYMKEINGVEELSSALEKIRECVTQQTADDKASSGWKIMVRVFDRDGNWLFNISEQDSGSLTAIDGICYATNSSFADLAEELYSSSNAAEQYYLNGADGESSDT